MEILQMKYSRDSYNFPTPGSPFESSDPPPLGTFVKVVRNKNSHSYRIDDVVKVTYYNSNGTAYRCELPDGTVKNWLDNEQVVFMDKPAGYIEPEQKEVQLFANFDIAPRVHVAFSTMQFFQNWQVEKLACMASSWNKNVVIFNEWYDFTSVERARSNDDLVFIVSPINVTKVYGRKVVANNRVGLSGFSIFDFTRTNYCFNGISGISFFNFPIFKTWDKKFETTRKYEWRRQIGYLVDRYGSLVSRLANNEDIFVDRIKSRMQQRRKDVKYEVDRYNELIEDELSKIRNMNRSIEKLNMELIGFEKHCNLFIEGKEKVEAGLANIEGVKNVQVLFEKDKFKIACLTKPVLLDFPSCTFPMRSYTIIITINSDMGISVSVKGAHPHVHPNADGDNVCFGGFKSLVNTNMESMDFRKIIEITVEMLKTYNPSSVLHKLSDINISRRLIMSNEIDFMRKVDPNEVVEVLVFE